MIIVSVFTWIKERPGESHFIPYAKHACKITGGKSAVIAVKANLPWQVNRRRYSLHKLVAN